MKMGGGVPSGFPPSPFLGGGAGVPIVTFAYSSCMCAMADGIFVGISCPKLAVLTISYRTIRGCSWVSGCVS